MRTKRKRPGTDRKVYNNHRESNRGKYETEFDSLQCKQAKAQATADIPTRKNISTDRHGQNMDAQYSQRPTRMTTRMKKENQTTSHEKVSSFSSGHVNVYEHKG